MALAGVTACTVQPEELIVPYVRQPEEEIPGKPLFFATAMTLGGVASGLLVESHEGRPTKIEGNPDHPASQGATDLFAQGSILTLYDPDRSQTITQLGDIRPWSAVIARGSRRPLGAGGVEGRRPPHPHRNGRVADAGRADSAGARAASGREVDPVGAGQSRQRARGRAHRVRPVRRAGLRPDQGRRHPVARRRLPRRRKARTTCYYMRQFASRRRVEESADNLNRLYVVEVESHGDRRPRRQPPAAQVEPDRSVRARGRRGGIGVGGISGTAPAGIGSVCRGGRQGSCRRTGAAPS